MKIQDITSLLEKTAPLSLQESYDNAGLIVGNPSDECTGVMISLDATEAVIKEAKEKKCNLLISHHPIVFKGLKKINGKNYVERALVSAIKNDVALYAAHTNLDNVIEGVSGKMGSLLGLTNCRVLAPASDTLQKLSVYVPLSHQEAVMEALFAAGAGHIGNYSECSFILEGKGTFKGNEASNPVIGIRGQRHTEPECKIEVVLPVFLKNDILRAMKQAHPYEEVAYYLYNIDNQYQNIGSGLVGDLPKSVSEAEFLETLSQVFKIPAIRHSPLVGKPVKKVALCGGAGSFLIPSAVSVGADIFITGDLKYHEFFDADNRLVLADIGHFESEQYTIDLIFDLIKQNFPTFAVLKSTVNTNPVHYFNAG